MHRFFIKLTTKSIETVKYCQEYFDFSLPSVLGPWTIASSYLNVNRASIVFCLCYNYCFDLIWSVLLIAVYHVCSVNDYYYIQHRIAMTALITSRLCYVEPARGRDEWPADCYQTFWLIRAENGTNWSRDDIKRHQKVAETARCRSGPTRWAGGTCRAGSRIHYGWTDVLNVASLPWKIWATDPSVPRRWTNDLIQRCPSYSKPDPDIYPNIRHSPKIPLTTHSQCFKCKFQAHEQCVVEGSG